MSLILFWVSRILWEEYEWYLIQKSQIMNRQAAPISFSRMKAQLLTIVK